ncbi:MAG: hypothetical protein R6W90_06135 [Ignavibacteriaceae bacterium]
MKVLILQVKMSLNAYLYECMNCSKKIFVPALVLSSLLVFSSCGIFDHRDAEDPSGPRANFRQPVQPEDVLDNLKNALKDKNVDNYLACFADSNFSNKEFIFSPSAGAASQFPDLADMWNKKNEEHYFNSLKIRIPENVQITLTLSNENLNQPGDSVIYTASYTLSVPHNDTDIPMNYQGDLRFSMARDLRSIWSIYYWVDIKRDDEPSWSELKGRFY